MLPKDGRSPPPPVSGNGSTRGLGRPAACVPRGRNSDGFTGSFVGLLSASASFCCANPRKAPRLSGVPPKGGELSFRFCFCSTHMRRGPFFLRSIKLLFELFKKKQTKKETCCVFLGADSIRVQTCTASSCCLPDVVIPEVLLTRFYKLMNLLKS